MSIKNNYIDHANTESWVSNRRGISVVWDYFEKINGDDGSPKSRCTKCGTVYNTHSRSGTSTLRRHLPKCFPEALTCPSAEFTCSKDERPKDPSVRAAKKSKSVIGDNLQTKPDRELREFIWRNKRNIPLLEQKFPDKGIQLKATLRSYEDELDRRAKLRLHKQSKPDCGTSTVAIKIEVCDQSVARKEKFDENMAEDESEVVEEAMEAHADVQQESSQHCGSGKAVVKIEMDDHYIGANERFDENVTKEESTEKHLTVQSHGNKNQESSQYSGIEKAVVKVEMYDQYLGANKEVDENMTEEKSTQKHLTVQAHENKNQESSPDSPDNCLIIVECISRNENFSENRDENVEAEKNSTTETHETVNQPSCEHPITLFSSEDTFEQLRKVSSMLSMITSADSLYTPPGFLDEEAKQAKQTLSQLLKKDFESVVDSPDELLVKSSIKTLMKNLDKLPMVQGRVVEGLNVEFETACQNWRKWCESVRANIVFEMQQADNLQFLQQWQEKDSELESNIAELDKDILRLKAELHEKELARERFVNQKLLLFDQNKISIEESKKLLLDMVSVKLQSDVALDNIKDLSAKWERMRENFQ